MTKKTGKSAILAPQAKRKPTSRQIHGVEVRDEYAWLRAENWRDVMRDPSCLDKNIAAYLKEENAYADDWLAASKGLQRRLVKQMRGRIQEDESTLPMKDGAYAYFTRFREGGQYPLVCRQPAMAENDNADVEILLDGDKLAKRKSFFDLGSTAHSPNHALLAWSADSKGSELYTIRVRDLASGEELKDKIQQTSGDMVWSVDSTVLYYVRLSEDLRPAQVYRHVLGSSAKKDALVYDEADAGFFVSISASQAGDRLIIDAHGHTTSECHLLDLTDNTAQPVCVEPRCEGVEYEVAPHTDSLFILTNADAQDFKLVQRSRAQKGAVEEQKEILPHKSGRFILSLHVVKRFLIVLVREAGLPSLIIHELATGKQHSIAFTQEAYALGILSGYEFDTTQLRFIYASMTTPAQTYDYDLAMRTRILRKSQSVPSGHDSTHYVARRIFATSCDGETIPISLMYHKNTPQDGSAPLFLYAYGAYGHSIGASFRTNPLSLVDRGFVYAIAHVRGGTEKGRRWYEEGKLQRKPNSFTDFIACAKHLIAHKFTHKGAIIANGGSAGGMVMGAIANLRPDLFAGIIAEVPFVDVLNTMLDDSLPLTPPEWPEWGNPILDPKAFAWIKAYSPYDYVTPQVYPAILALGGLTDPRVTYWEPAKWVARLRANQQGTAQILLKTNMEAGHGGASGRFDQLVETAQTYAFALRVVGKDRQKPFAVALD